MTTAKTPIIHRRLLWKELRQLLPLALGTLLIGILLLGLYLINQALSPSENLQLDPLLVLNIIPAMFAVGVGAILVGHEKDQRTILWLTSLPIPKQSLIRSKWIATLAGWMAIWILSLLGVGLCRLTGLIAWDSYRNTTWFEFLSLPLHSLYLSLAGLALAWKTRSSFAAMIWLLPFAFLPYLLVLLLTYLTSQFNGSSSAYHWTNTRASTLEWSILLITCCLAVTYWGWHNAWQSLQASSQRKTQPLTSTPTRLRSAPHTPVSALIWQFTQQNRQPLFVIVGLFLLSFLLFCIPLLLPTESGLPQDQDQTVVVWAIAKAALAICGCGVLTFQGDRFLNRIRFLADRGISPRLTWLTRHAVPASLAGLGLLLALLVAQRTQPATSPDLLHIAVGSSCLLAILVYAVAQWIGHLLPSPVLAMIAAPFLSLASLGYAIFTAITVGISPWLLAPLLALPFLATYLTMRPWMDSRYSRSFWLTHAVTLTLFLGLPWLNPLQAWLRQPKLNPAIQLALEQPLDARLLTPNPLVQAQITSRFALAPDHSDQPLSFEANSDAFLDSLASALASGQPLPQYPQINTHFLQRELAITASRLEPLSDAPSTSNPSPTQPASNAPPAVESSVIEPSPTEPSTTPQNLPHANDLAHWSQRYSRLIQVATDLAKHLRPEPQLEIQEVADSLEILILLHLQKSRGKPWLDAKVRDHATALLANKSLRHQARRTALAHLWNRYRLASKDTDRLNILRTLIRVEDKQYSLVERVEQHGRFIKSLETLWRLSDAKYTEADALRLQLATWQQVPPTWFGLGDRGQLLRADHPESFLFNSDGPSRPTVGTQWQAGWEEQGLQLIHTER